MSKKPADELAKVQKLQQELADLQKKMAKVGSSESRQGAAILAQVAKLAREVVEAGEGAVMDQEKKTEQLKEQAKRVQLLIKQLGNRRG